MAESPVACLVKIKNGDQVRAHIIMRPKFIIGRSNEVDLPFASSTVSRQHLKVELALDSITITDLKSNNGTFLDGIQLQPEKPIIIQPMNKLKLGASQEEISFQVIPLPLELMPQLQQKEVLLRTMTEVRAEMEQQGRLALEEERKANLASMQLEKEQMRLRVQNEIEEKRKSIEAEMRELLSKAQKKADDIIAKGKQEADGYQAKVLAENIDKKSQLEAEIRKLEDSSKVIAAKIKQEAEQEAETILHKAKLEIKQEREQFEKERGQQIEGAKRQAEIEIEQKMRLALDEIRVATMEEQERIMKEYQNSIHALEESERNLKAELSEVTQEIKSLSSEKSNLAKEVQTLKDQVIETRRQLADTQQEVEKANRKISLGEIAEEKMRQAESAMVSMKAKFEQYKHDYDSGMKTIEDELQSKKEKLILEFEEFQKKQAEDLAQDKLKALERLKSTIQEEEIKYTRTVELRAVEIAEAIESKLLPKIQIELKKNGTRANLSGLLDLIRSSVDEVVLKEKPSIKAVTEHLGVDPEKEEKRKARNKRISAVLASSFVIALGVFAQPLFDYFKANKSTYAESLVAKRTAESIYIPIQSDEWKETYTGNVLHLRNYYQAKTDDAYESQWALKLSDLELLRSMNLTEDEMIKVIGKEGALVRQLWTLKDSIDARYLDEGLGNMNEVEIQAINDIKEILKEDVHYETFRRMEKDFTTQYLRKRFGKSLRLPTEE